MPYKRFFARLFDYFLASFAGIILLEIIKVNFDYSVFRNLGMLVSYLLVFPIYELMAESGRTVGKSLFNLEIVCDDDSPYGAPGGEKKHIARCWLVWLEGCLFYIFPITFLYQWMKLSETGKTTYDRKLGTSVIERKISFPRLIIIILSYAALLSALIILKTLIGSYQGSVHYLKN